MTQTANTRCDAGAVSSKFGGFKRQHNRPTKEAQFLPGVDECVYRLRRALRSNRLEGWEFNFVRSILRHSKRRDWEPSDKQLHSMRTLVAELAEPEVALIDDGSEP